MKYGMVSGQKEIVVPKGFVTDLASIPKALWWWEAPQERALRLQLSTTISTWMNASRAEAIYFGVRTRIGDAAFRNNRQARTSGKEARTFLSPAARRDD